MEREPSPPARLAAETVPQACSASTTSSAPDRLSTVPSCWGSERLLSVQGIVVHAEGLSPIACCGNPFHKCDIVVHRPSINITKVGKPENQICYEHTSHQQPI